MKLERLTSKNEYKKKETENKFEFLKFISKTKTKKRLRNCSFFIYICWIFFIFLDEFLFYFQNPKKNIRKEISFM
jgi:hypothetical protein